MAALGKARLYFRAGVEFENAWMDRITHINPRIKVIDTRRGIELLPMAAHHDHDESDHVHHGNGLRDPHIWLSLRLVKIQAETICEALEAEVPSDGLYFRKNLEAFHHDLDSLDREISETLQAARIRKFMVFHPAWGYLARDYGLEQIPIEIEGKEPNAKDLVRIIKEADEEGIKVLLVQKQFSRKSADAVAQAIGGTVIRIDGLPRDYLNDMRVIVETLKTALQ
jgi:zinc transport system substrate-binding protein